MRVKTDMEITVKVPFTIVAADYHEFYDIERVLQRLNKKIRVTELGLDQDSGSYVGLVHGTTAAHKKLIKELSARLEFVE